MNKKAPNLIGSANFANGERFSIFQHADGKCLILNERTGNVTHASTPEKAWASVRYMARISQRSERTAGVEAIDL